MARITKKEAPTTQRVRYSSEGKVEEIRGMYFDVPVTIKDANKGAWIESRWREQQAREAAEVEKANREATVLRDRQAEIAAMERRQAEKSLFENEIESVRQEISGLRGEIAAPDIQKFVELSSSTTQSMGRVLDANGRVSELLEQLAASEARVEQLHAEALEAREVSLKLVSNYQQLLNGVQKTHGDQLAQARLRYEEAEERCTKLNEQIGQNWEVVKNAATINETAIAQATAASKKLIERQHKEFLSSLTVVLGAIGVTQEQLDAELNRLDQAGYDRRVPILEPSLISQMVQMTQKHQAAREDAERRTNQASADSAGRLEAASFLPIDIKATKAGFKRTK